MRDQRAEQQNRDCRPGGSGRGLLLRRGSEEVWEGMEFSAFGACAWSPLVGQGLWLFRVGSPNRPVYIQPGGGSEPFYLTQISTVQAYCLKAASTLFIKYLVYFYLLLKRL